MDDLLLGIWRRTMMTGPYNKGEEKAIIPEDVRLANARLIAAAPDLLAALAMIVKDDNAMDALWQHFDSMEMDKISAAIAKAQPPTKPSKS